MTSQYHFGTTADGREVTAYKITNSFGEYAVILNLGAAIQGIWVRDKNGEIGPVVLGADEGTDPSAYRRTGTSAKRMSGSRIPSGTIMR